MGFLAPALTLGGGILSGILGSHGSGSHQTQTTGIDPRYQPFENSLLKTIQARMANGGLPEGYNESGIAAINRASAGGMQSLQNRLTSLGIGGSPSVLGAGTTALEEGRIGNIGRFLAEAPLKGVELQNQNIQLALSLLGLNRQTTTTGTTGEQNPLAAGLNVAAGLAPTLFPSAFGRDPDSQGTGGGPTAGSPFTTPIPASPSRPASYYGM